MLKTSTTVIHQMTNLSDYQEISDYLQLLEDFQNLNSEIHLKEEFIDSWKFGIPSLSSLKEGSKKAIFLTSGIHGPERIGISSAIASFRELLNNQASNVDLYLLPFMNPYGFFRNQRSNKNNVDLMRNSPIYGKAPFFFGGHRISSALPYYMGPRPVSEVESEFLFNYFNSKMPRYDKIVSLDFHSGFGFSDSIWFPFSYSSDKFPLENIIHEAKKRVDKATQHKFVQQSKSYKISGDLWDWIYLSNWGKKYIPLTVEIGTWKYFRFNPLKWDLFNPPDNLKEEVTKKQSKLVSVISDFMENWND